MSEPRDAFARYRERLAALGFRPSKQRGQNFLVDPNLHRVIADSVDPGVDDLVLEVGPGLGFLTRELVARGSRILACEIDTRLAKVLRQDLAELEGGERVSVLVEDVISGEGSGLSPLVEEALAELRGPGQRLLVIANLPYSITGPFLAAVFRARCGLPDAMGLLVQQELAERLAAAPGGRTYGALSATLGTAFRIQKLRKVPPEAFRPRPKVESAIIRLELRDDSPVPGLDAAQRAELGEFIRALFASRRKKLRSGLREAERRLGRSFPASETQCEKRPEELPPDELLSIWSGRA